MIGLVFAAAMAAASPAARPADPVVGTWMNRKETVAVATRRCGRALCGRVVWAAPLAVEAARAGGTDRLVGTEILRALQPAGQGLWEGEVFVADLGQAADAQVMLLDASTLEINGCQYGGLLCKKQTWHKVRALPR
ncbi:MAG: hypothetical protein JWP15_679 [Alphaproteobacteria bacterium]|nr:hypothetical protein [Alphaproteobacteria bacterium]